MELDNYPTDKVVSTYALLGGAIGGILIGIFLMVIKFPRYTGMDETFGDLLIGLFSFALYGAFFGLIPAMMTGWCVANRKIYLDDKANFFKIFVIGFIVSGFFTAIMTVVFLYQEILSWLKYIFIFGSIGGLSSIIVGKFVLPKEKIHANN